MLSYSESLKILKETEALLEGHFILSSGLHSNRYVQCAKLLSQPMKAEIICVSLVEKIKNNFGKIDIVLSPAIGGIVVGYIIGKHLEAQTIFAERVENKLCLRRGFSIPKDSKVLVVEDVVTTGKSALECSKIVMKNEAKIIGYACIIDRSNNKLLIKDKIISQIKIEIPIFGEDDLPNDLKKIPAIKPGSRDLSNE
jgi:orotate phosphoribosyltransferase